MTLLSLMWKAVLFLSALVLFLILLFCVVILIIVATKTIKKEVQNDDSKDVH